MQFGDPEFKTLLDRMLEVVSQLALRIMLRWVIWVRMARRVPNLPVNKAHLRSTT